jgi:hypothetical protein
MALAQPSRAVGWGLGALLWVAAAGYFLIAATHGIERVDEGHLVYLSQRVADGALPVRDFRHWYGPAVFVVNGLLFRLFEPDLLVIRLALVALHASLVAAVFVLTRALAGTGAALVVGLASIVLGGVPLWVFHTPYATNYQLPLTLGALAAWVCLPSHPRARLVLLGVCLGLVTAFKPTGGILPLLGVVTFVLSRVEPSTRVAQPARLPLAALASGTLVGVLAVLGVMGASIGGAWSIGLLLGPSGLLALWALGRVRRASPGRLAHNLVDLCLLGAGFVAVPVALAVYYAAHGLLGALAFDVLLGLPRRFIFAVPYPLPSGRVLLLIALAAASVVAIGWRRRALGAVVVRAVVVAGMLGFVVALVVAGREHLTSRRWLGDVFNLLFWLPPVAVWTSSLWLTRSPGKSSDGQACEASTITTLVTAALLPGLAPVSDLPHVLIALPAFLPITAWMLCRARGSSPALGRRPALALLACWVVGVTVPAVAMLASVRSRAARPGVVHARATWITDDGANAAELSAVVEYLRARRPRPERLLTVPSHAVVYFLAGLPSALDADEFAFYAGIAGPQLSTDDARAMVDQRAAVQTLAAERPLVVRVRGRGLEAFGRTFPEIAAYLGQSYRPVASFGPYEVLEPASPGAAAGR